MFEKLKENLSMLSRVTKDTNWTFKGEKLQCLRFQTLNETKSRLGIAGKVTEFESSNRKYPVGNTEKKNKRDKYVSKALVCCDTTWNILVYA